MALDNTTPQVRLNLANALASAEAAVRANIQAGPVNYPLTVNAVLLKAAQLLNGANSA